jgi:putative ABC transport system permease protein
MHTNTMKIAWRQLKKNRVFSLINLSGLALGLAAALAVLLYVRDELAYEAFHEKSERIARAHLSASFDGRDMRLANVPNAAGPFIAQRIPEVEQATRVFPHRFGERAFIRRGDAVFTESRLYWGDPNVFEVFSLRLTAGAAPEALTRPHTAVLSSSAARRYFGGEDPIGQTLKVDNAIDLEITGIFEDLPANTHFPIQVLGAFSTIGFGKPENESWGNASFPTFLLLRPGADLAAAEAKIVEALSRELPEDRRWFSIYLKPLRSVHLYSPEISMSGEPYGDIRQVRILIGLAILLLLVVCVNYMNLATARSQQRAKEVGVSKTLGASSWSLARQFYTETALLTLAGILFSVAILSLALPYFNQLSGKALSLSALLGPSFLLGIIALWLLVALAAGAYPALYLSSFSPLGALRQHFRGAGGAALARKGLVVFQFCVSTALIVATLVLHQQMRFIRDKKLGYQPEQVVAVRVTGAENAAQVQAFEEEARRLAMVNQTARTLTFPGGNDAAGRTLRRLDAPGDMGAQLATCRAYPEIFEVLDLTFLAGRPMRRWAEGDTVHQVVLNRSAVEYLGLSPEDAVGRRVEADLGVAEIAGVVEDFHFGSLHHPIGFYAFHNAPFEWLKFVLVKLDAGQLTEAMRQLETAFKQTIPGTAFDYTFLDDHLAGLYDTERRMAGVMLLFAVLAILVACLGLFALAAYTAEQRAKEIGIRKILGATARGLVALMSKDFLKLVLASVLIAMPLSWYAMNRWLQTFAYRVELQGWLFLLAALLALAIAFLTVSLTSARAAMANPVEALRDE